MRNKDYRELQLSSPQVVLIFIGILILGVVVFLFGVSVGKKQAKMALKSQLSEKDSVEQVKQQKPQPVQTTKKAQPEETISKELASHQKIKEETQKKGENEKPSSLYYIQVGAFNQKQGAYSFAEKFRKMGYETLMLKPLPSDKKPVYRVRLGGYTTKKEAQEIKAELIESQGKKKSDYFIIRD
ncbi:SPOR domain-containing protein [bacterium]|nr:SPOR domain-containing protein [bacterium]